MREIKFRAWDGKKMMSELPAYLEPHDVNETISSMNSEGIVLMQYTGLKDKNGKEIYEGDILYVEFEKSRSLNHFDMYLKKWTHVVEFKDQSFNIPDINGEFRQALCTAIHNQNKPTPEWEIIGNIYENKELLK